MYLVTPDKRNYLRVYDKEIAERLAENINGVVISTIKPFEISIYKHDKHIAKFHQIAGLQYVKDNKLEYTSEYRMMLLGGFYTVICGDILVVVEPHVYPDVKRLP